MKRRVIYTVLLAVFLTISHTSNADFLDDIGGAFSSFGKYLKDGWNYVEDGLKVGACYVTDKTGIQDLANIFSSDGPLEYSVPNIKMSRIKCDIEPLVKKIKELDEKAAALDNEAASITDAKKKLELQYKAKRVRLEKEELNDFLNDVFRKKGFIVPVTVEGEICGIKELEKKACTFGGRWEAKRSEILPEACVMFDRQHSFLHCGMNSDKIRDFKALINNELTAIITSGLSESKKNQLKNTETELKELTNEAEKLKREKRQLERDLKQDQSSRPHEKQRAAVKITELENKIKELEDKIKKNSRGNYRRENRLLKLEEKEQPITIDTDTLFNEIIVSPPMGKTDYSIIASWKKALPLGFDGIVANLQQEYIREKNKVPSGAADRSKQLDTIEELFRKKLKDACAYPLGPKQIEIRDKIIDFLTHSDSKEELIQKLSPESQAILKKQKADAVKAKFDAFDEMKKEAEKILPTLSAEKQAELKATYSDEKKGKLPIGFDGKVVDSVMSDILRSGHDESAYAKKIQELQKDVLTFLGDKDNNEKILLKFSPEKRAKLLTIKKLMQLAFPIEVIEKGYICKTDVTNDLREKERCYFEEMSKKNDFAAEFASIPGLANLFELNPLDCEHLDEVQKRNKESANKSGLSFLNLLNQNK